MKKFTLTIIIALLFSSYSNSQDFSEEKIIVKSEGWELVGDLVMPVSKQDVPGVVLFNKANGTREVYRDLPYQLARRGVASLRVDLRGHGESTNLGKFIPYEMEMNPLIWDAEKDVIAVVRYMKNRDGIDPDRIGTVGASYSGEEMAEAGRLDGYVNAYVELSPGSFSDESIDGIDESGVPWLFIVSRNEKHLTEITAFVQEKSVSVELIVIPGTEHASRILNSRSDMAERIAIWLTYKL